MKYRIKVGNWTSKQRLSDEEAVRQRRSLAECLQHVEIVEDKGHE